MRWTLLSKTTMKTRRLTMFKLLSSRAGAQAICASRLYDNTTFYRAFIKDLQYATRYVYIESPFITKKRIDYILLILSALCKRGVSVTVNTRHPDEHDGIYIDQAYNAVAEMQALGVRVLYTIKHHRKLAIIDDTLWEGSLNILSQNDSCEIMRRSVSSELVRQMAGFIRVSRYI